LAPSFLGFERLFDEPVELKGLLYIFGLTLAALLILSIRDNLSLRLLELDLLNLSLIFILEMLLDLEESIFLDPLLPLTNEKFVFKFLP
tara:strand:- start:90 stop:356 length:267 start_codon:yes stop_codon:yes gene_type:complete